MHWEATTEPESEDPEHDKTRQTSIGTPVPEKVTTDLLTLTWEGRIQTHYPASGQWPSPQGTIPGTVTGSDRQWGFQEAHSFHRWGEMGQCCPFPGKHTCAYQRSSHAKHMPLPRNRACNLNLPWVLCRRCWLLVFPDSCRRWGTIPTPDWKLGPPCVSCGFPIFSDETSQCKWIPTHTRMLPSLGWREEGRLHIRKTRSSFKAGGFSYANFKTFSPLFRILKICFESGDICKYWSPGFLLNNPN